MEDCNLLAAEAVVISCCCPCLILQIIVFVLLKLPYKLIVKSKRIIVKRLPYCCKRKRKEKKRNCCWREDEDEDDDQDRVSASTERDVTRIRDIEGEVDINGYSDCSCVLMEVEQVFEDLSQRGEFAFGSFWRRDDPCSLSLDRAKEELDTILRNQLIEIINSMKNP